VASRVEGSLKGLVSPGMLFEDFGFQYFGPFDGHNLTELIEVFPQCENGAPPIPC